jgi:16S rRNA (uracil1498-N3)-methyltransferase
MKEDHFLFFIEKQELNTVYLSESETHHATGVLRADTGDLLSATDGKGMIFTCKINGVDKGKVVATVIEKKQIERNGCEIHLFIGLPDRDIFEQMIIDLTALGVVRISPVISQNCRKPWWEKWEKFEDRFAEKMVSAIKQSLNAFLPVLDKPVKFKNIPEHIEQPCFVADQNGIPMIDIIERKSEGKISCFVGPPGGFSEIEMERFKKSGYQFVKIAPNRLRTELASIVLVSQITAFSINQ